MKPAFDQESGKWRVLKKECIFIGKFTWCIEKEGFKTKADAQTYIDEVEK